jgi:Tfp pilus assembly protein PilN
MNPKALALIVGVVVVVVAAVVWLVVRWLGRQSGIRRADFARLRDERNLLARAIAEIDEKTDTYRDIDSVLATEIRAIVRTLNADRLDLTP